MKKALIKYLANCAATHTILKQKNYFSTLATVHTEFGSADLIESSIRASITLPGGTTFIINNDLFS